MRVPRVPAVDAAGLALRAAALRGTAVYMAYLAASDSIDAVLVDVSDELGALDPAARLETLSPVAAE